MFSQATTGAGVFARCLSMNTEFATTSDKVLIIDGTLLFDGVYLRAKVESEPGSDLQQCCIQTS